MRVYRSPLRLFVFGLVGLFLIVAAIDVLGGHWLSTPPEAVEGVLGTRGQAQQRGDVFWGGAMLVTGVFLVGGSIVALVRRKPQVVVGTDELTLAMGKRKQAVDIPWRNVRAVSSDLAVDPYDGSDREQLVVDVYDIVSLPEEPIDAEWDRNELRVDAHEWSKSVTDVALSAQGALAYSRRVETIKDMGPPSLVWATTVYERKPTQPDSTAAEPDDESSVDAVSDDKEKS